MEIQFSVKNLGGIRYTGTPPITISTDGDSKTINPELDLAPGESQQFKVVLKAPQKQGSQTLTVSIKTKYSTIEKSVDYKVRVLNPTVTTLSTSLQEDNGIHGTISIGSPFSPELVDWSTTAVVEVYKIIENGKKELYSKDIPITTPTFNIAISYNEFYRSDGQYLVTIATDGMQDTGFFEIIGEDYTYTPGGEGLPPTLISSEFYPQLIMLLIGLFAGISFKKHINPAA